MEYFMVFFKFFSEILHIPAQTVAREKNQTCEKWAFPPLPQQGLESELIWKRLLVLVAPVASIQSQCMEHISLDPLYYYADVSSLLLTWLQDL